MYEYFHQDDIPLLAETHRATLQSSQSCSTHVSIHHCMHANILLYHSPAFDVSSVLEYTYTSLGDLYIPISDVPVSYQRWVICTSPELMVDLPQPLDQRY